MDVQEFVRREMETPNYPGGCCNMADRWFQHRMGFSALERYGRSIQTEQEVSRWLNEPGGIAVAVNRVMRRAGVPKTKTPQAGDVGLVFHGGRLVMSVHAGAMWVSRDENGMIGMPLNAVWKAWRCQA